jgi:putative solute:sodium symporter small subunit
LGFWIAQQGAIYLFVILIFLNAWLADRESRNAGPAGAGPGDPPVQRTPGA